MTIELTIEGVPVQGRLEKSAGELCVELLEPYSGLSSSLLLDQSDLSDLNEPAVNEGRALLARLYRLAQYTNEHQLLLRDILSRIFQRLELLGAGDGPEDAESQTQTFRQHLQRELEAFFAAAFPEPVPEDCWESLLRLIARSE